MAKTSPQIPEFKSKEISSFKAWYVVLTSALFFFYIFIQMNLFNSINSELVKEFHLNAKQMSNLFAFFSIGNVVFLFPAGIMLDRFSVRKLLLIVFAISVIGTYLFASTSTIWVMNISRLSIGLAGAFALLSAVKLTSRWFDPRHMALVVGIVVTIAMLGGMIAQTPLTLLTESLGWRTAMKIVVGLGVLLIVVQFLIIKDEPKDLEKLDENEHKRLAKFGFWHSLGISITNAQNWLSGIYISLVNLPLFIFGGMWGVPFLTQVHNFTKLQATVITSMIFIGMMIGSPLSGVISDQIGLRKKPMIIGAVLAILVMIIIMYAPTLPFIIEMTLFLVLGLIISAQVIGYPLIAESNPHAITATATSLGSVLIMSGGFLVPLFGWLLELSGENFIKNFVGYTKIDYLRANWLMLGGLIVALIASLLVKETYCKMSEKLKT